MRRQILKANREKITPELLDALTSIVAQMGEDENQQLAQQMKEIYRLVLRMSMEANL